MPQGDPELVLKTRQLIIFGEKNLKKASKLNFGKYISFRNSNKRNNFLGKGTYEVSKTGEAPLKRNVEKGDSG